MSQSGFDELEFRDALGRFPTGVAVVTTVDGDGRRHGVTVNSFTSVSLSPPLVSFNLALSLKSIDAWLKADSFAINLLRQNQHKISSGFARAHTDKWACAPSIAGVTANPVLTPNLVVFECRRFAVHPAGDHVIVIGEVVHLNVGPAAEPLLFYRGRYRRLEDDSPLA